MKTYRYIGEKDYLRGKQYNENDIEYNPLRKKYYIRHNDTIVCVPKSDLIPNLTEFNNGVYIKKIKVICECGAESLGYTLHTNYCPKSTGGLSENW